jgi:hypothetical protein
VHLAFLASDKESPLLAIIATILLAVTTYVATSWLLWRSARCPNGPETEAIEAGAKLLKIVTRQMEGLNQ